MHGSILAVSPPPLPSLPGDTPRDLQFSFSTCPFPDTTGTRLLENLLTRRPEGVTFLGGCLGRGEGSGGGGGGAVVTARI